MTFFKKKIAKKEIKTGLVFFFFFFDVGFTMQNTNSIDKYNVHDYYIFIKQNQLFTFFG